MNLVELYDIALNEDVEIIDTKLPLTESMSLMTEDNNCYIGIDYSLIDTENDEKIKLAHELGHCMTRSFYRKSNPLDIKSQHELRAEKWSVQQLLPVDDIEEAFKNGVTEVWELANYFEVTEDLVRKALWIYFDIGTYWR